MILLRTSSVARAPVYAHLRSLGVTLVLVHPVEPLAEFNGVFNYWLPFETADVAALEPVLMQFLADHRLTPHAIVSFDEYAVYQAAKLAESLKLQPVPLPSAAIQLTNLKERFRLFCREHSISSPQSICIPPIPASLHRLSDEAPSNGLGNTGGPSVKEAALQEMQRHIASVLSAAHMVFPIVLKPSPGAGSLLVRRCHDTREAAEHVLFMRQRMEHHPDMKHFTALIRACPSGEEAAVRILAEEYIEGQEVDLDCVVEHGVVRFCSISDNTAPTPPYFAELGGLCPSALAEAPQAALRDLLQSFVDAHGPQLHGVLHFEAKYDEKRGRAYVIEVNCRLGSAETNTMVKTAYCGLELGESLVRCALGISIMEQLSRHYPDLATRWATVDGAMPYSSSPATDLSSVWQRLGGPMRGYYPTQCWAASINIFPTCEGILQKVEVPTADPSLVAYTISAQLGDAVAPPPTRFYLLSWMVARGKSIEEAYCNINVLTNLFQQIVEPPAS